MMGTALCLGPRQGRGGRPQLLGKRQISEWRPLRHNWRRWEVAAAELTRGEGGPGGDEGLLRRHRGARVFWTSQDSLRSLSSLSSTFFRNQGLSRGGKRRVKAEGRRGRATRSAPRGGCHQIRSSTAWQERFARRSARHSRPNCWRTREGTWEKVRSSSRREWAGSSSQTSTPGAVWRTVSPRVEASV